jgi:hypothetical protein
MFSSLFAKAKSAIGHVVEQQLLRASVAVPFLLCLGYALAGATAMLGTSYGWTAAYWIMAGAMALIGIVASVAIAIRERKERAQEASRSNTIGQVAADALVRAPTAIARSASEPELVVPTTGGRMHFPLPLFLIIVGLGSAIYAMARSDARPRRPFFG